MDDAALHIGLFGIGLDAYWLQFPGLKERLKGNLSLVNSRICSLHPSVINLGLVDNIDKAFAAGKKLRMADPDIVFLYAATYALSSTILPVVQKAKLPVIILNLSPDRSIMRPSIKSVIAQK